MTTTDSSNQRPAPVSQQSSSVNPPETSLPTVLDLINTRLSDASLVLHLIDPVRLYTSPAPTKESFAGSSYVVVSPLAAEVAGDANSSAKLKRRLIDALAFMCATERDVGGTSVAVGLEHEGKEGQRGNEGGYTLRIAKCGSAAGVGEELLNGLREIMQHLEAFADGASIPPSAAHLYHVTDAQIYIKIIQLHASKVLFHLNEIREPLLAVHDALEQHIDAVSVSRLQSDAQSELQTSKEVIQPISHLSIEDSKRLLSWINSFSTQISSALDDSVTVPISPVNAAYQFRRSPHYQHLETLCRALGKPGITIHMQKLGRYKAACRTLMHTCQKWPALFSGGLKIDAVEAPILLGRNRTPSNHPPVMQEEVERIWEGIAAAGGITDEIDDGETSLISGRDILLRAISEDQFLNSWQKSSSAGGCAEARLISFYDRHPECIPISGLIEDPEDVASGPPSVRYIGLSKKPCYQCSLLVERHPARYLFGGLEGEKGGIPARRTVEPCYKLWGAESAEYLEIIGRMVEAVEGDVRAEVERRRISGEDLGPTTMREVRKRVQRAIRREKMREEAVPAGKQGPTVEVVEIVENQAPTVETDDTCVPMVVLVGGEGEGEDVEGEHVDDHVDDPASPAVTGTDAASPTATTSEDSISTELPQEITPETATEISSATITEPTDEKVEETEAVVVLTSSDDVTGSSTPTPASPSSTAEGVAVDETVSPATTSLEQQTETEDEVEVANEPEEISTTLDVAIATPLPEIPGEEEELIVRPIPDIISTDIAPTEIDLPEIPLPPVSDDLSESPAAGEESDEGSDSDSEDLVLVSLETVLVRLDGDRKRKRRNTGRSSISGDEPTGVASESAVHEDANGKPKVSHTRKTSASERDLAGLDFALADTVVITQTELSGFDRALAALECHIVDSPIDGGESPKKSVAFATDVRVLGSEETGAVGSAGQVEIESDAEEDENEPSGPEIYVPVAELESSLADAVDDPLPSPAWPIPPTIPEETEEELAAAQPEQCEPTATSEAPAEAHLEQPETAAITSIEDDTASTEGQAEAETVAPAPPPRRLRSAASLLAFSHNRRTSSASIVVTSNTEGAYSFSYSDDLSTVRPIDETTGAQDANSISISSTQLVLPTSSSSGSSTHSATSGAGKIDEPAVLIASDDAEPPAHLTETKPPTGWLGRRLMRAVLGSRDGQDPNRNRPSTAPTGKMGPPGTPGGSFKAIVSLARLQQLQQLQAGRR